MLNTRTQSAEPRATRPRAASSPVSRARAFCPNLRVLPASVSQCRLPRARPQRDRRFPSRPGMRRTGRGGVPLPAGGVSAVIAESEDPSVRDRKCTPPRPRPGRCPGRPRTRPSPGSSRRPSGCRPGRSRGPSSRQASGGRRRCGCRRGTGCREDRGSADRWRGPSR